jgi:hypothetical protein
LQLLVKSQLANNDLQDAERTVQLAMHHPRINGAAHILPQWLFIQASTQFLKGEIKDSFRTLNSDGFISKQTDEWNVNLRLLEMMQLVEFGDEEWLEFKINSTKRFMTRNKQLVTPRVKLALDVMSSLLRNRLDFNDLPERIQGDLVECLEQEKGYAWQPDGVEMVRFDKWVMSKNPVWLND